MSHFPQNPLMINKYQTNLYIRLLAIARTNTGIQPGHAGKLSGNGGIDNPKKRGSVTELIRILAFCI
jgi:hypothetical protein